MHENARLKSATEAMLKKLKCEIQEMQKIDTCDYSCTWCVDRDDILTIIQEKINALKEREDGTENAD